MKAHSLIITCCLALTAGNALALGGEVFSVKPTESIGYCAPMKAERIPPGKPDPIWIRIDSPSQLSLSRNQAFPPEATDVLTLVKAYPSAKRAATFVAATPDSGRNQVYIFGTVTWNAAMVARKLTGNFISRMIDDDLTDDCIMSGQFKGTFVGIR